MLRALSAVRAQYRTDLLTQSSNITGSGTLSKLGLGELVLSGTNTFSGLTTVAAGTLTLSGGSALNSAGAVVLADGAAASLQLSTSQTIGSIAGGAGNGALLLQGNTLTFGDATSTTLSALISGSGGLVKQGAGTVSLGGVNTFTGGVALNGGTLALLNGTAIEDSVVLTLANTAGTVLQLAANERVGIVLGGGSTGGGRYQ